MALTDDLANLLEHAIKAFADRDFLLADDTFEAITRMYPNNWTARYFHAMTLCAIGDFSEARQELLHICDRAEEPVWRQVSRSAITLVNKKEQSFRQSLAALLKL